MFYFVTHCTNHDGRVQLIKHDRINVEMIIKLCTVLLCISLDCIKRRRYNMVNRLCTLSEARE